MATRTRMALLAVVLLFRTAAADAQSSAAIIGTVRDDRGGPVPGATVTLRTTPLGGDRIAVTDPAGAFEAPGLVPAQTVEIVVAADGFASVTRTIPGLTSGERRMLDFRLAVGPVAVDVEVSGDSSMFRTPSPELGGHVDRPQLERLPINGRDLLSVAFLVPGAAPSRGFYNLAPRLTINGASSLSTNYSVDGFDNTDLFLGGPKLPVTVGSADDVQVLVNAYSPEYGRTGNGVFLVTTRSGGNRPAADLFYTARPGAILDAPNFFAPRDDGDRVIDDSFRRHQFGGSAGGPVARDRVFFMGDLEASRERQDAILTSPLAIGLAPTAFDNTTAMGKIDVHWNDAHQSTLRYHGSDSTHDGDVGFIGGLTLPSAGLQVNYRNHYAAYTHRTIAGAGFNELGLQLGQLRSDWRPLSDGPRVVVTDRGATLATIGAASDNFLWTETDVQVRDVLTRLVGRHTVKMGADLLRGRFAIRSGPGARGAFVVDLEGRTIQPASTFLALGDIPRDVTVLSYSQTFVNPEVRRSQLLAAAFIEDTVRASDTLTLTVGSRWDYDSVTNTPVSRGDLNNVAPRLGMSWTPRRSQRHQLRAGYGIFYERIPFAVYSDTLFNNPDGGAVAVTFAPGTPFSPPAFPDTLPRDAVQGLPTAQLPPRNVQVFDPDLRSPWTEQASAGYLLSLSDSVGVAVDYVHSRGRNLIRRIDTNAPTSVAPGAARTVAAADLTRPLLPASGGFRMIEQDASTGRSTFDGLYLNVRKGLTQGTAVNVAYTVSRIRNNTDDINFRPVDSRRPDDELGPSLNDRRHVLAVNGLVRLPGLLDLAPVLFLSSGQPLNVTTGRDDNGDTVFNDRPAGVSRNSGRTAGFAQFDLGVVRDLRLGAARVQVRADIFNVFNRTNFSGFFNYGASGVRPDENGTLAFQPTVAGPARQFQFAIRTRF